MRYYYHFTFEKYYKEMLEDGFIKPGKHQNYLPYDKDLNIGELEYNPSYSKYIYLAKSVKELEPYIINMIESGPDFLNKDLALGVITNEEYIDKIAELGEIIILKIPATFIDTKYLIDDFNNIKRNNTYAYPLNISIKEVKVLESLFV